MVSLIDVAIERRAKFMGWIQENYAKIEKDALDHRDWNEFRDIHAFLQVFHQIQYVKAEKIRSSKFFPL